MPSIRNHRLGPTIALVLAASLAALAGCGGGGREAGESGAAESAQPGSDTTPRESPVPAGAPAGAPAAEKGQIVVADVGLQSPESVLYDETADVYLVSNINGGASDKDDNGFVSRVSPEGKVLDLKWIDGAKDDVVLNAPKGLAAHGDSLFVADIDTVRVFDRRSGRPLGALGVPGATFLNDLATGPDGTLYVTDTGVKLAGGGLQPTGTDALYRFESEKPVTVVRGKELQGPNGVAVDGEGPVMVTFGGGRVYRVAADGSLSELKGAGAGQLDGLVILPDGSLVISSWEKKTVYRYWPKGEREGETAALGATVESPADIGYDAHRERILVPSFNGNRVETRSIGP